MSYQSTTLVAAVAALGLSVPAAANPLFAQRLPGSGAGVHIVESGQSLWGIARTYGCMPDDLHKANGFDGNRIHPGQALRIPLCVEGRVVGAVMEMPVGAEPDSGDHEGQKTPLEEKVPSLVRHQVAAGESLYRLAKRYDTSVIDIQMRNGLTGNSIFVGQTLEIAPGVGKDARAVLGQSVGVPYGGRLVRASRLPRSRSYYLRRPDRAFGAAHVVHSVRRAMAAVARKHRRSHRIAIGDLSARRGGPISGHRSHQSGRDVDIGFVYKKKPRAYPREFVVGTARNLDFEANWTLLTSLAATAGNNGGVERIFLGYDVQELLYKWARRRGTSQRKLNQLFQYPHGRYAMHGLVRHEPAHNDHFHVRFSCLDRDRKCE